MMCTIAWPVFPRAPLFPMTVHFVTTLEPYVNRAKCTSGSRLCTQLANALYLINISFSPTQVLLACSRQPSKGQIVKSVCMRLY